MKKTKNRKGPKTHKIMNHPILALFLMPMWCMLIASVGGGVLDAIVKEYNSAYPGGIGVALFALLCLAIHKGWFKGEFVGNLRFKNAGTGLLLILPGFVLMVMNMLDTDFSVLAPRDYLNALFLGMAPGIAEEVAFRGLSGSNMMRVWRDENKIPLAVVLTALVFGGVHLLNVFVGASQAITVTQGIYAIGLGILFAAVYFRTGTLWPSIVTHTLIDASAFLNKELVESGGVLTDNGGFELAMLIPMAAGIICAALGFRYIRKEKRGEIIALWDEKWKRTGSDETPPEEGITTEAEQTAAEL